VPGRRVERSHERVEVARQRPELEAERSGRVARGVVDPVVGGDDLVATREQALAPSRSQ
jgi:hypothetical protein